MTALQFCHPANGFYLFVVIKQGIPAKMPYDGFIAKLIFLPWLIFLPILPFTLIPSISFTVIHGERTRDRET